MSSSKSFDFFSYFARSYTNCKNSISDFYMSKGIGRGWKFLKKTNVPIRSLMLPLLMIRSLMLSLLTLTSKLWNILNNCFYNRLAKFEQHRIIRISWNRKYNLLDCSLTLSLHEITLQTVQILWETWFCQVFKCAWQVIASSFIPIPIDFVKCP